MGFFDRFKVKKIDKKFEEIFAAEYSGYEIQRNVQVNNIFFAEEEARPYNYVISSGYRPLLCIIILDNRNHGKRADVLAAIKAAERNGVSCIRFFTHLPNEPEYISQRIKQYIRY